MSRATYSIEGLTDTDQPGWRVGMPSRLIQLWQSRHSTRCHLRQLEPHHLSDVGLSDADRRLECEKWFWQA